MGQRSAPARRSRGQAMVEFALVFPILLLLLVGVTDLSRVFYHSLLLAHGARAGAWVATDPQAPNDRICAAVVASGPTGFITCESVSPSAARMGMIGRPVTVTASYQFTPITPAVANIMSALLVSGQLKLQQNAQMVIL